MNKKGKLNGDDEMNVEIKMKYEWEEVKKNETDNYVFPDLATEHMRNIYKIPVVYRWLFKDKNDTKKIYIGETQELVVNRLYNYRKNDGEVNVRVRDEINNWTNNEKIVVLEILKIVSLVIDKRKNTPKQISNFIERKNSRVLIESLLLENLRSANNVEILNLNI